MEGFTAWFNGLFKCEQPIARLEYFLSALGFGLLFGACAFAVGMVLAVIGLKGNAIPAVLGVIAGLVCLYVGYLLNVKRIWDLTGELKPSFYWALGLLIINFIPVINLIALVGYLMLLFCPSGTFEKR